MDTKNKPRLLIVDDDRVSAAILQKRCEARGYEVDYLSASVDALDVIDIDRHAMVILDVLMPKISGIDILKQLRQKYSNAQLPVIMITSRDDSQDIASAFEHGANDYIVKPVNMVVAMARIQTQLNMRKMHEQQIVDEQIEAVKALVVTYNHEINNPLAIALGHISILRKKNDTESLEKIQAALLRISDIVKKIEKFKHSQGERIEYIESSKMYKI